MAFCEERSLPASVFGPVLLLGVIFSTLFGFCIYQSCYDLDIASGMGDSGAGVCKVLKVAELEICSECDPTSADEKMGRE